MEWCRLFSIPEIPQVPQAAEACCAVLSQMAMVLTTRKQHWLSHAGQRASGQLVLG